MPYRNPVGLCQRGIDPSGSPTYVFRNLNPDDPERFSRQFTLSVDGNPPGPYVHGNQFTLPVGNTATNISITSTDGTVSATVTVQPYQLVCTDHNIFHFFHDPGGTVVWAIGDTTDGTSVQLLSSTDYFNTYTTVSSWPAVQFLDIYRSMYIDKFGNIIVGSRPSPIISRDQGATWQQLGFQWMVPNHGVLCPFWNITELEAQGLLIISEYGDSLVDTQPRGGHRGTFWSFDQNRTHWYLRSVDKGPEGLANGFDQSDPTKFGGYFRHIHGYHVNPNMSNIHLMFLGDGAYNGNPDGTPGLYISQDSGFTWSTECLSQYDPNFFYNGPCFVTWWPNGKAFITSDTADTGHAYWWGNGPNTGSGPDTWGGPGLNYPAIELQGDVDEECSAPDTPWMGMAVTGSYETYCSTSTNQTGSKELIWRYDGDPNAGGDGGLITVLCENYLNDPSSFSTLKWLSGSRGNTIPANSPYFFAAGGRRFPRRT
ncbi:MAG TPA: hypothetical protein V6C86_26595 [Oculatellaceae cyanobacterium]